MKTKNDDSKVMFFHGKTVDDYKFTISGLIEGDALITGIAICSGNDNFSKAKGRLISTGRLFNQRQPFAGKKIKSAYSLNNSFLKISREFDLFYWRGNEMKVFLEDVVGYGLFTKKELTAEFNLVKKYKEDDKAIKLAKNLMLVKQYLNARK